MAPGWTDLLRFPEGSCLRVELTLKPEWRQALETASRRATLWLRALEGAVVHLDRLAGDACALRCSAQSVDGRFTAAPGAAHGFRLHAQLDVAGSSCAFDLDDVSIQIGGDRDAYLVRYVDGGCCHLARLSYDGTGDSACMAIFGAALAAQLPPRWRTLMPARLSVARVVALPATAVG